MGRWLKSIFFVILLVGAAYLFGTLCKEVVRAYELILSPSSELLYLLLWFFLAWLAVAVTGGLVAALLRPTWLGILAFWGSGVVMLWSWQVDLSSGLLTAVYALAAAIYVVSLARELDQRVRFSVGPVGGGQGLLMMSLVLMACGGLYLGSAAHIERHGFSIPSSHLEMVMKQVEKQVEARVPPGEREKVLAELRQEFPRLLEEIFQRTVKPHEDLIPLALAASLFMTLVTVARLLAWVPTVILGIVFPLLAALGVTETVTESRDVQRVVIG